MRGYNGRFQRRLDPTFLDRFYGLAEDNEGRLVTINENKGGRVRERSDGTRCIEIDFFFMDWFTFDFPYSTKNKVLGTQAHIQLRM